jgi:hypothetical protein
VTCVATVSLILATLGFLSPASRGALLTTTFGLYVLMSALAGYVAVWLQGQVCTARVLDSVACSPNAATAWLVLAFVTRAENSSHNTQIERTYDGWVGVCLQVSLFYPGILMAIFTGVCVCGDCRDLSSTRTRMTHHCRCLRG